MPKKLASWPRPRFAPGGGDALLYYVVFGDFDLSEPLSASKYRSAGPGDWLRVVLQTRAEQPAEVVAHQTGIIWEHVRRDAPATAAQAERAPHAVVVSGKKADPRTLDYFRDAIGVVEWLLDRGGVAVLDLQRLSLWSADEWREEVFAPGAPRPLAHTVILVSDDERNPGRTWLHTRGMRQYGRPDLSVRGVGPQYLNALVTMIERFIDLQALGGVIAEGEEVRMKTLPPGGVCRHRGSLDDVEFNNVHVAVNWDNGALE